MGFMNKVRSGVKSISGFFRKQEAVRTTGDTVVLQRSFSTNLTNRLMPAVVKAVVPDEDTHWKKVCEDSWSGEYGGTLQPAKGKYEVSRLVQGNVAIRTRQEDGSIAFAEPDLERRAKDADEGRVLYTCQAWIAYKSDHTAAITAATKARYSNGTPIIYDEERIGNVPKSTESYLLDQIERLKNEVDAQRSKPGFNWKNDYLVRDPSGTEMAIVTEHGTFNYGVLCSMLSDAGKNRLDDIIGLNK